MDNYRQRRTGMANGDTWAMVLDRENVGFSPNKTNIKPSIQDKIR